MTPDLLPAEVASKIEVSPSGCWIWNGWRSGTGYGCLQNDGRVDYSHRYVYETLIGPIPKGLQLDHLCLVKPCCNPEHVEPVTIRENKRRWAATRTHCKNGHLLEGENVYHAPTGRNVCRPCRAERARALRAKATA